MPSMPVFFWGDDDGHRLHDSYFADYPGVWRHGDWIRITSRGSCVIEGRSDATLNRGGVRMGTAEFYRVVESLPQVHRLAGGGHLDRIGGGRPVAVRGARPSRGDDELPQSVSTTLRTRSARNCRRGTSPALVIQVPAIPQHLERQEVRSAGQADPGRTRRSIRRCPGTPWPIPRVRRSSCRWRGTRWPPGTYMRCRP